ncbi:calcium/sodium antiporter [Catenovulum maritimum]|uniref:Calcium/sodium:proton antiporter n=1 Tax=Catenovulum maritimum TaxID=1513271 RepID=A0A0J8GN01_9ALTE|nr:calcium/sodium antiporter [Catenovulum maritimum]KMT64165.1 calcium/sodium:proton antiporter [Catenovulum maritimum]
MLYASTSIVLGLVLLVWSADRFVVGASSVAKCFNLPPLLIGMVIVGFGTSTPELFVSCIAAFNGDDEMAIGNALGSNIVNISLILGITALIAPITVASSIIRRELPVLLVISILLGILIWDMRLDRLDAFILLAGFFGLLAWTIKMANQQTEDPLNSEFKQELSTASSSPKIAVFWTLTGLITLIASSQLLVWGGTNMAEEFGVSKLVIGLTIVAIGTSLPELVTSVTAALKGEHDVAIGNVIGSNMFNLLAVVGLSGVVNPMVNLNQTIFWRDWLSMLFLTVVLLFMAIGIKGVRRIGRVEGAVLVSCYGLYTFLLFT